MLNQILYLIWPLIWFEKLTWIIVIPNVCLWPILNNSLNLMLYLIQTLDLILTTHKISHFIICNTYDKIPLTCFWWLTTIWTFEYTWHKPWLEFGNVGTLLDLIYITLLFFKCLNFKCDLELMAYFSQNC
jgi:hypothetical protein